MDIEVMTKINLSPEQVAAAFWVLDEKEQADFFAALYRSAGSNLCFQMAWVVMELTSRMERGDLAGYNGFMTMLAHAQGYPEAAAEWRASRAKSELRVMANQAKVAA